MSDRSKSIRELLELIWRLNGWDAWIPGTTRAGDAIAETLETDGKEGHSSVAE